MGFHHHPYSSPLAPHSQMTAKVELKTSRVSRLEGGGCAPALPTAPWAMLGHWGRGASQGKQTQQQLGFHNAGWGEHNSECGARKPKQKCFTDRPQAFPVMSICVWQEGCESCSRYLRQPQNTECAAQVTTMK